MTQIPDSVYAAGPLIAGLKQLCIERQAQNGSSYLTESEYSQMNEVLAALEYEDQGVATEWKNSLHRCLFG